MIRKRKFALTDEYAFLRARAAELLDEGHVEQAKRLLNAIDRAQVQWIKSALMEQSGSEPAKGI